MRAGEACCLLRALPASASRPGTEEVLGGLIAAALACLVAAFCSVVLILLVLLGTELVLSGLVLRRTRRNSAVHRDPSVERVKHMVTAEPSAPSRRRATL